MMKLMQSNLSHRRLRRTTVWQLSRPKPIWNFYDNYKEDFSLFQELSTKSIGQSGLRMNVD